MKNYKFTDNYLISLNLADKIYSIVWLYASGVIEWLFQKEKELKMKQVRELLIWLLTLAVKKVRMH